MPEEERRRERRGLFGRKKKRGTERQNTTDGDSTGTGSVGGERRKKKNKGFGRQIRRLVGGRKKSKLAGDDVSTVEVFEKDDSNYRGPRTGLDPDVLAQVLSRDEPNSGEGPHLAAGRFGSIDEGEEEDEEEEESENEDMLYGSDKDDEASDRGELVGPLEIVLVLIDPQSLRFELLQLEFETPQLSKVSECLEQVKDIVTESALKSLEFHSVLDRQGNCFPAKVSLGKALTCRRRGKDILVGISKGITADQAGRLARPILGDAKVMQMLEMNGYRVKGWAKDPKEQSELKDSHKDRFIVAERKRQLRSSTMMLGLAMACYILYHLYVSIFGVSPIHLLGSALPSKWLSGAMKTRSQV